MKMQNHFDPVTFGSKAIPTLVRLLRQRADEHPAQPAYTFLSGDDLTNRDSLTYEELDRRARQIALLLHEIGRGERVLLCLPPGLDYVAAYFGCLYAGVIAVPVYPIDPANQTRNDRMLSRLRAILHDSQATALLTTSALLPAQQELMTQSTKPLSLIPVDTAYDLPADTWRAPNVRGDNVAMLMYTSGSTGSPRGVMVSHANLMHNLSAFPGFTARPCTTVVSWLPLFHDLGLLLGVLHPLYRRARAVLFAPTDFVQKPLRWLKTMSQEHASTTGAPNFAYELCIRRTTEEQRAGLDLSAWTMALNGAEPVRQDTLDRFTKVFEPYGFRRETCYPSYGLAEATATVSGGGAVSEPLVLQLQSDALTQHTITIAQDEVARSYVGCGEGIADQTIAIVDPENQTRCQAGRVGEIWLASPSVARGYWNRPEETKATFQAYLADTGAGPFLRTGDLGFVQDGQLFITGRLKDVIIVHGSNHYPQDIEHTVERSHAALRPGGSAAFALDEDGEERLIVVCEVASRSDTETHTIFDNIRQSITEQHDIDTHTIALIPPGNLPKTSSGKVQRRACRERYLAQTLEIVACWQKEGLVSAQSIPSSNGVSPAITRTDVQGWLVQHLASRLGIAPDTLDIHQPFARYGLASVEAVGLAGELADWLERPISPTVVWEHPTIERLAQYITVSTVQARENGRTTPLAEPIAIVGMSCRLPGVNDLNDYWELLYNGIDAVGEVPPERWDVNSFYAADRNAPGKTTTRWGGFLERLEEFDARFFNISPREAAHLDPRQRVLMELSYEALELAGISFEQLAGSATGVFMAALSNDYDQLLFRDLTRVDAYSGSGTANSILANRLSYFFDLRGPSVTLDTACSGSLVAIHLACQSIQNGESTLALAGGISINLLPNGNIFFSKAGALAADGRCKTFDAGADGIVRSEGAGVIVLKSLAQALADKDPIYAVIRGSAVNSDGRSNGIMAPNGKAQEAVLWDAYRRADIDPGRVQYIEAHGTGTSVGDPIELQALGTVLSHGRTPGSVCHVSSVKTNIGHTEAAAGVAGLIKVALALKHGFIPPTIHYQSPNPLIPFDKIPLTVADTPVPWQANGESRIAGVSSFGFGGTNAHVVLEGMPRMGNEAPTAEQSRYLLPISAQSEEALRDLADAYRAYLESGVSLPDLCYTASIRRPHYEQRLALVGETNEELAEHLAAFVRGEPRAEYSHGRHVPNQKQRIVFVFSGQGSHWVSMGRELFDAEPVFRSTIERCDKLLQQFVDWSLIAQITAPDNERLNETSIAQPAIFAVQVALAELWRTWGITPDVVVGQSLGEVAAAYCAGALSLDDAIRVVVHRSRLMQRVAGHGRTAVVGLPPEKAQLTLTGLEDSVAVAGNNSPDLSVLAGDPTMLERILGSLERQGIFCRLVRGVDIAFHSPQMDPLVGELVQALDGLQPSTPTIPLYSTVNGTLVEDASLDATYWGRNLREPFSFASVVTELAEQGYDTFLEVSPHPVLTSAITETLQHHKCAGSVIPSLRRDAAQQTILTSFGKLYVAGHTVDWQQLYPQGICIELPTYPWQRQRYWFDQLDSVGHAMGQAQKHADTHPLLGEHLYASIAPHRHFWEMDVNDYTVHYMRDHRVNDAVVWPAAAYLEMALAAMSRTFDTSDHVLCDMHFKQALFLSSEQLRRVQVVVTPEGPEQAAFAVHSVNAPVQTGDAWVQHAYGHAKRIVESPSIQPIDNPDAIRTRCTDEMDGATHYQNMQMRGLHYGATFRAIERIWRRDGEALGLLQLPAALEGEAAVYSIHPALLDSSFQMVAATLSGGETTTEETFLPVSVACVQVHQRPTGSVWCHAVLTSDTSSESRTADISLFDESNKLIAEISGLRLQRIDGAQQADDSDVRRSLYELRWIRSTEEAVQAEAALQGRWLIFTDQTGIGTGLANALREQGAEPVMINRAATYGSNGPDSYTVNPTQPDELQQLMSDIAANGAPPQGIMYLWALDLPATDTLQINDFDELELVSCEAVMHLVQGCAQIDWQPKFWLVTRGAQPIGDEANPQAIAQSPLWGLGRVFAQEHPELYGGLIDLDDTVDGVGDLIAVVSHPESEEQIAIRAGTRYVPRLERYISPTQHIFQLRPDASYLITGGLGGLGLEVARWLVERGARSLVLVGRTPLPPRATWEEHSDGAHADKIAAICGLERLGATIHYAAFDITNEEQLTTFLTQYQQECRPPLRGIVHAAGVLRDQLLLQMDTSALHTVLHPKLRGTWLLHRHLQDSQLDFFVMFSSAAAVLGSIGQGNYAAGNAFMDALAHNRRAHGLSAVSLNWGPWAEVGMATDLAQQHEARGVRAFTIEQGLEALRHSIEANYTQVVALQADWQRVRQGMRGTPLLAQLARDPAAASTENESSYLAELLSITDPSERQAALEERITTILTDVMRLDRSQINADQPLTTLGIDSIVAVEMKYRIETHIGITLSMTDLLSGASITQLATRAGTMLQDETQIVELLDELEQMAPEDLQVLMNGVS